MLGWKSKQSVVVYNNLRQGMNRVVKMKFFKQDLLRKKRKFRTAKTQRENSDIDVLIPSHHPTMKA